MLALTLECEVSEDHQITLRLPDSVACGKHQLIVVVDQPDWVDAMRSGRRQRGSAKGKLTILAEDETHLADFKDYMA